MTPRPTILLGRVYSTKWDKRPSRIIGFDKTEVFYDCYEPSLDKWTLGQPKRKEYYFRTGIQVFQQAATFIREQPLTPEELQLFRPDLPIRVYQNQSLSWTPQSFPDMDSYAQRMNDTDKTLYDIALPVPQIRLHPFGTKGRLLKSTILTAQRESGFSVLDLLWQAHNLQAPHLREKQKNGIGIFRLGHEKRMPTYMISIYELEYLMLKPVSSHRLIS